MPQTDIITIDGPSASGKGTLARRLARHLNYFYLDTGAIYRLIGLALSANGIVPEEKPEKAAEIAQSIVTNFTPSMLKKPGLKSDQAGQMASRCAVIPELRAALEEVQRKLAYTPPGGLKGTVMDGRDCGTVICPDAPHKFYITADVEARAERRVAELQSRGDATDYATVLEDMQTRDDRDMNRAYRPLKPTDDAITIDTSTLTADDAFETVLRYINS